MDVVVVRSVAPLPLATFSHVAVVCTDRIQLFINGELAGDDICPAGMQWGDDGSLTIGAELRPGEATCDAVRRLTMCCEVL
jgi:hypothetical protein